MSWWAVAKVGASALGSYMGSKGSGGSSGSGGSGGLESVDIAEALKGAAQGFKEATPYMIDAEKAMRPAMQDLALSESKRALMGGDSALREERDTAEAAVEALKAGLSAATSEIRTKLSEVKSASFNVETQREEWKATRINLQDELVKTTDLKSEFDTSAAKAATDRKTFSDFRKQHSELINPLTGKLKTAFLASQRPTPEVQKKYYIAKNAQARITKHEQDYGWLETQAEEAGFKDATSYLDDLEFNYDRDVGILTDEIAARPEDIATYEPYIRAETAFNEKKEADLGVLASQIENLKKTGQFSDDNYEVLKGEFEDAAAAVLEGSPGILDLAEYSINRQAGVGERLKEAALKNEFRIMQELAPELVEMYRETNKPAVALADIVSEQADLMIKEPNRSFSDQQVALTELRTNLGLSPNNEALETKVAAAVSTFIDQKSLGSPQIQKDLSAKVGSLMSGPSAGRAEDALFGAAFDEQGARRGPSAEAQTLSTFGQGQLAPELAARGPSAAESALGITANERMLLAQREARAGLEEGISAEEAIAQRGLGMLGQDQGESLTQGQMRALAMEGMGATVREPGEGSIEEALGLSAMRGLASQQRATSPQENLMQRRIGELIASAGQLTPLERQQIEQQTLGLQMAQGRGRDLSTAAAVSGRLGEARRADLGQNLDTASGLMGQQDALIQARIQEQLQAMGVGQQGAASAAGLETARQQELLTRQAQGLQAGMTAEQMEIARQQQGIVTAQAGAGLVTQADALEQARIQELLSGQMAGTQMTSTAGQLEAQRQAEFQAQQGTGIQALTQSGGLTLQQTQQELSALEAAAKRESARETQLLQGVGISAGISEEGFRQDAMSRDVERQGLVTQSAITSDLAERDLREQAMVASLLNQEQSMEDRRRSENYAREQQALTTAGQAFTMQQRIAPDVTAYMGRPASQGAGMDVLGVSQQQAQYGTTPQAFNYDTGINVAMAEQANLAGLTAANRAASAAKSAGMWSAGGNILGNYLGTEAGAETVGNIFGGGGGAGGGGGGGGGGGIGANTNAGWQLGQGF